MKKEILFSVLVLILCTYLQFGRQETVLFSRISATETTCTHDLSSSFGYAATLLPVPAQIASSKSLFTGSIRRRAILVIRAGTGMLHDA